MVVDERCSLQGARLALQRESVLVFCTDYAYATLLFHTGSIILLLKIKTKKVKKPLSWAQRSRFSELGRALSANGIARFRLSTNGDALFRFRSLLRARRSSPPIGRRSCKRTRSVTSTRGKSRRQPTALPCVPSMDPFETPPATQHGAGWCARSALLERRRRDRRSARQRRRSTLPDGAVAGVCARSAPLARRRRDRRGARQRSRSTLADKRWRRGVAR